VKAKGLIAAAVVLGVLVLTQTAGKHQPLQTRVGRDVTVFKQGCGILARLRLPGRHQVEIPCSHVKGEKTVLVVDVTRAVSGRAETGSVYANHTPAEVMMEAMRGRRPAVLVCDTVRASPGADAERLHEGAVEVFATDCLRCLVRSGDTELRKLAATVRNGWKVVIRGSVVGKAGDLPLVLLDGLETGAPTPGRDEPPWTVSFHHGPEEVGKLARTGRMDIQLDCPHAEGKREELTLTLREFKKVDLRLGGHPIEAEVADTPDLRSYGMQGRAGVLPDHGMWFVFERPYFARFVMKTVSFPLSIAFVRADGTITNIEKLNPGDTHMVCSQGPVLYVLEMEQGWFDGHGVEAGDRIDFPVPELPDQPAR
jgi:uncharacterized membrane protein (UPF0127 family)